MLTSFDKKEYTYIKENFDKLYPSVNQKVFSDLPVSEKIMYTVSTFINIYCLIKIMVIMKTLSFVYNFIMLLVSYFVADIVSGVVHWLIDSYSIHPFLLETPYLTPIGNAFQESVIAFRMHHIKPHRMSSHDVLNTSGSTFCLVAFVQMVTLLVNLSPLWNVFIGLIALMNIFSNEFHKISHMNSKQMNLLQKTINSTQIFLTKEKHRSHHHEPEEQGYTMLSGLFNPLLDHPRIRLWERLEYIMYWLFGIKSFRMINKEKI